MLNFFLEYSVIIYVFITLSHFVLTKKKTELNKGVYIILIISFINEIISGVLYYTNIPIGINYSITAIIHNIIWLVIICEFLSKKAMIFIIMAYLVFSLTNLVFFEGSQAFNYLTFIFGALIYISLFIFISFKHLKEENFIFFNSIKYLLLFVPILFLFGFSFIFGFKSNSLSHIQIIGKLELYDTISLFSNFIYYSLINVYIYREKKLQHA